MRLILLSSLLLVTAGCIQIGGGGEPIRFEGKITIEHEIKIKIEKDVEQILAQDDLF